MMARKSSWYVSSVRLIGMAMGVAAFFCLLPASSWSDVSADIDNSGYVDSKDLLLLHEQWHQAVPPYIDPSEQAVAAIQSVSMPVDKKPEVTFSLVDGKGKPVDLSKVTTIRFTIARIIEIDVAKNRTRYQNYILNSAGQPTYDSGGKEKLTALGNGAYKFKFNSAINITQPNLTHTIGAQIQYNLDGDGFFAVANPLFNFRPDGGTVTNVRELSTTDACNACHNPLALHGGGRRDYGLCTLCHHPDVVDPETGASVDMAHMIHQIHISHMFQKENNAGQVNNGINSVSPYVVIGYQNSVHDYSEVTYPQDVRNCDKCHTGSAAHPEQASWNFKAPSRLACSGCHDKVNFANGQGHGGGIIQADDNLCTFCHSEAALRDSHLVPRNSPQLPALIAEILDVTATAGSPAEIQFRLAQAVNNVTSTVVPSALNRVAVTMAGPTTDYSFDLTETITDGNSTGNPDGSRNYTFNSPIDASATGTFAFALEARSAPQTIKGESVRSSAPNPVVYVPITGQVEPRREVVDWNKCLNCHDVLSLHGDNRNAYGLCIMCHRPGGDDEFRRNAGDMPPESIDMKYMIHKIHSGRELAGEYTVYGYRVGSATNPVDFKEVTYPGDRRDCEQCHLPGTYGMPAPAGALDTVVTQELGGVGEVWRLKPTSAACLTCHDNNEARQHAQTYPAISGGAEKCIDCHGDGKEWSTRKVHYRGL